MSFCFFQLECQSSSRVWQFLRFLPQTPQVTKFLPCSIHSFVLQCGELREKRWPGRLCFDGTNLQPTSHFWSLPAGVWGRSVWSCLSTLVCCITTETQSDDRLLHDDTQEDALRRHRAQRAAADHPRGIQTALNTAGPGCCRS